MQLSRLPEDPLGHLFGHLFRLRGVLDPTQALAGLEASASEVIALDELAAAGQGRTQQALGAALGLEKSTVSRLVDGLLRKGWVERGRDPRNRRYQLVRLTPEGRLVAERAAAAMRDKHARVMEGLSEEERRAVAVGLGALLRELSREHAHPPTTPPAPPPA